MRWYRDLYIGDNARKKVDKIIEKVNKNKLQKNVFLITKAANGCDLFDIYPAHVFLQKHFKNSMVLLRRRRAQTAVCLNPFLACQSKFQWKAVAL
mgnify:CR=1 FL=1